MPHRLRTRAIVQIFLASPGDVAPEKEVVSSIVEELNLIWSRDSGLVLELVNWETHAWPGADVDPQALINRQLPNEYEIFLGIMWSRLGTATNRAASGTVEEFQRAFSRFKADPESVHIMFYFKSAPPPLTADPIQVSQVLQFRRHIESDGVLPWMFASKQDLARQLRLHLSREIQAFREDYGVQRPSIAPVGWGYRKKFSILRLVLSFYVQSLEVGRLLNRTGKSIDRAGAASRRATAKLQRFNPRAPDARAQFDEIARDLHVDLLELTVESAPTFADFDKEFEKTMESVSKAAPLFVGRKGNRLAREVVLPHLRKLYSDIEEGMSGVDDLRLAMEQFGGLDPVLDPVSAAGVTLLRDGGDDGFGAHPVARARLHEQRNQGFVRRGLGARGVGDGGEHGTGDEGQAELHAVLRHGEESGSGRKRRVRWQLNRKSRPSPDPSRSPRAAPHLLPLSRAPASVPTFAADPTYPRTD